MPAPTNLAVYRSSAGSGKTYPLDRDYLGTALPTPHPTGFRHILAITFTNKAAEEMKTRVLEQLASLAENNEHPLMDFLRDKLNTDIPEIQRRARETLRFMLHNYAELSICTIDKFM